MNESWARLRTPHRACAGLLAARFRNGTERSLPPSTRPVTDEVTWKHRPTLRRHPRWRSHPRLRPCPRARGGEPTATGSTGCRCHPAAFGGCCAVPRSPIASRYEGQPVLVARAATLLSAGLPLLPTGVRPLRSTCSSSMWMATSGRQLPGCRKLPSLLPLVPGDAQTRHRRSPVSSAWTRIVTVYEPDNDRWSPDFRVRRR